MKKKIAKLFVISLLTLASAASCNKTSATTSSDSGEQVSSSTATSDVKITYNTVKSSYEVGETFTIRFTVTTSASDKKLKFTLEDQSENSPCVTGSDKKTTVFSDGVSVSLYGKKKGTATLVATSCADESVSVRIPLTISAPVATLQNVWKKVNNLSNYTLNITRNPTTDELNEHDSWSDDTQVPYKRVKVTDDVLITEVADELEDDVTKSTYKASYTTSEGKELLGLATDKEGYVFTLLKDSTGYVAGSRDTTGLDGFRTNEDISGNGDDATSPNNIYMTANGDATNPHYYTFGGLRCINSTWLSHFEKSYDNTYEIAYEDGDTEDETTTNYFNYVKASLYEIVDPDSFMENASASSTGSFADIVADVDVTITCLSNNSVSISLVDGSTTYTLSMSDVGTTTVDSGISTFMSSAISEAPAISYDDITALQAAIATNDYYSENSTTYGTYYTYYYNNYYLNYYPESFITAYKKAYPTASLASGGVALIDSKAYQFTFTDEVKDADGNVTTPASITIDSTPLSSNGTIYTFNSTFEFASAIGSYAGTKTFGDLTSGYLYSFNQLNTGSSIIYYSSSKAVSDELFGVWSGGYTLPEAISGQTGVTFDNYDTELTITKTTTKDEDGNNVSKIASVQMLYGTFTYNGTSGYCYSDTIKFDTAAGNKYHSIIENAITNFGSAE